MLQNLPSVVAALALSPTPGSRVLDMCASPGGKTTLLAQLMGDAGEVFALDRTHSKADDIRKLCDEMGVTCVQAFKMDATKAGRRPAPAAPPADNCAGTTAACGIAGSGVACLQAAEAGVTAPSPAAAASGAVGGASGKRERELAGEAVPEALPIGESPAEAAGTSSTIGTSHSSSGSANVTCGGGGAQPSAGLLRRQKRRLEAMKARGHVPSASELRLTNPNGARFCLETTDILPESCSLGCLEPPANVQIP